MIMMTMMDQIRKVVGGQWSVVSSKTNGQRTTDNGQNSEQGMSLIAILAIMTLFSIALLAVAPSIQQGVQREKELEAIRRGEEVAQAIRAYVNFYNGAKLPESIDDLLEGLPQGTKKVQILRESAAIDPLSEDGKWNLVPMNKMANFARRVQNYNNGLLPSSENVPQNIANQVGAFITNPIRKAKTTRPARQMKPMTKVFRPQTRLLSALSAKVKANRLSPITASKITANGFSRHFFAVPAEHLIIEKTKEANKIL